MALPSHVGHSVLDLIGSTPVVRLNRLPQLEGVQAEVWAKLENLNPGGSVKDRICLAMIEAAERDGRLRPGGTIIEPTSGNTGIGLALVPAVKGYRLVLTMPATMSEGRRWLLGACGAQPLARPARRPSRRHLVGRELRCGDRRCAPPRERRRRPDGVLRHRRALSHDGTVRRRGHLTCRP